NGRQCVHPAILRTHAGVGRTESTDWSRVNRKPVENSEPSEEEVYRECSYNLRRLAGTWLSGGNVQRTSRLQHTRGVALRWPRLSWHSRCRYDSPGIQCHTSRRANDHQTWQGDRDGPGTRGSESGWSRN